MWLDNYLIIFIVLIFIIFVVGIILSSIDNEDPTVNYSTLNKVGHYLIIAGLSLVLILFLAYC
jgi:hypothetical protein